MISGLINGVGPRINLGELGTYLMWALKNNDDECQRVACGLVSDLATNLGPNLSGYLPDFVPIIMDILRN